MRKLETMTWWPELLEVKDSYSLRELAERFGATPGAINNALKRNGISRKSAPPGPRRKAAVTRAYEGVVGRIEIQTKSGSVVIQASQPVNVTYPAECRVVVKDSK